MENYFLKASLALLIVCGLSISTAGCQKSNPFSQTKPVIDGCKDVIPFNAGKRGVFDAANIPSCFDWVIMSEEHYKRIAQ